MACLHGCDRVSSKPHGLHGLRGDTQWEGKRGDWMHDRKPISDYLKKKCIHTYTYSRNLPQSYESVPDENLA